MSERLFTVEEAAARLNLHPKTVRRHIRDGRLTATRIGKSYRIRAADLDAFAGIASGAAEPGTPARTTCIVDLPHIPSEGAGRLASFLHAAAMAGDAGTPPLHLETAFDPAGSTMKIVAIGIPGDVARLLELLHLHLKDRP